MAGFRVDELALAGGLVGMCPLPGRRGDLAADLAVVRAWRPDLVLTLVEPGELRARGAEALPGALAAAGVAWRHLPVPDFGTPGAAARRAWPGLAAEMQAALGQGGRVMVHCMGGCGRTGMMVMRMMVAGGEAPDAALARLRAVRPCAVETSAQRRWAETGA